MATTLNEHMARVPLENQPVTCTQCGHVGEAFLPVDKSPEIKAWGEELVTLAMAVAMDTVLDELKLPTSIDGCDKGLALARDRLRCLMHPVAGVPGTTFDATPVELPSTPVTPPAKEE
jgi:hypothetical protein